ncbi:MAG: DUF6491 family protein [Pseudomonadota bacterium]
MKKLLLPIISAALMTACSSTSPPMPSNTAVEDFIAAADLDETRSLRRRSADRWEAINEKYVLYTARREHYLLAFKRECPALVEGLKCRDLDGAIRSTADMLGCMDIRTGTNDLRAGFDTLRGCVISEMYPVNEGQAIELKNLGLSEIPGPPP